MYFCLQLVGLEDVLTQNRTWEIPCVTLKNSSECQCVTGFVPTATRNRWTCKGLVFYVLVTRQRPTYLAALFSITQSLYTSSVGCFLTLGLFKYMNNIKAKN